MGELTQRSAIEAVIGRVIGHMKAAVISAAAISKVAPAMPPTSSSGPSVTTFASFSAG